MSVNHNVADCRKRGLEAPAFRCGERHKVYFLCELLGGEATKSIETSDIAWFSEAGLPEIDEQRSLRKHLHRFFEHYRNPDLPTDFD